MIAQRPAFWQVEHAWIFYVLAVLALAVFGLGLWEKISLWRRGRRAAGAPPMGHGLSAVLLDGLLGRRIFKGDAPAGAMHLLIMWGFLGLFIGTCVVAVDHYLFSFLNGRLYLIFSAGLEVCGLMLLAGLLWALLRRYGQKLPRLERRNADLVPPLWLMLVALSGFAVEGARLAATQPQWAGWSFVGARMARDLGGPAVALQAYPWLWWFHAVVSLGFIAWLPWSKMAHVLAAPASLYMSGQSLAALGQPGGEEEDLAELGLRHLIQADACTRCGRCVVACPAAQAGEPISPREFMQMARRQARLKYSPVFRLPLLREYGRSRMLRQPGDWGQAWYCTTCRACLEQCPVQAAPIEMVRKVRAGLVEQGEEVPAQLGEALDKLYKYANPWLAKKGQKAAWSQGLDIPDLAKGGQADWLYFVGCTTSLDTRAQGLALALSAVLAHAGVSFGTLGKKEPCCGDIARRLGEQGLMEEQIEKTAALLAKRGLGRLVCSSPHCYDTFAKMYGAQWQEDDEPFDFRAVHYTQLLAHLVQQGALNFEREMPLKVTYHDPCYLSRHNRIIAEPRQVLRAIPGLELVEMAAHGLNSLCCGGGGGRMWHEMEKQEPLAQRRLEQAEAIGAQVVVTACPLCLIMLEDARKTGGFEDKFEILDLNELCARALSLETAQPE